MYFAVLESLLHYRIRNDVFSKGNISTLMCVRDVAACVLKSLTFLYSITG